jgi:hypothetical protein
MAAIITIKIKSNLEKLASEINVYDEFDSKYITYEKLIYKKIRCNLIHEADLPNLVFSKKTEIGNYNANAKLPITIIDMLNDMALNYYLTNEM